MRRIALMAALMVAVFGGAAGAAERVSFLPQWVPQAQFAGYYAALEKGFYKARGLDVEIRRGGPDQPPSIELEAGRVTFTSMFLTAGVSRRAEGAPIVNICQLVQRSALMLVAMKNRGIHTPRDLNGRRISVWEGDFRLQPEAFIRKYKINVEILPQSPTLDLFLLGGVDAASGMWYNEYHLLLMSGLEPEDLTVFMLADHGMNFPEDGIYCLEETLREKPEVCRAFVQATLEGWMWAFDNPEEALDIVMKRVNAANRATNRGHQRWMLARMKDIILSIKATVPPGVLAPEDYERVGEALKQDDLIAKIPDISKFFVRCVD